MGLEPQIAFELEFYLLRDADDGGGGARSPCPGTACTAPACRRPDRDGRRHRDDALGSAVSRVESWGSEFDSAAFEVNIHYGDAIPAADEAFLFRLVIREIAERHGKLATFLGRPLNDRGGSGLHVNFSFRREDGSNAFHDPNDPEGLSTSHGECDRRPAGAPRGDGRDLAPHVNAYKRLQPDMLNGYWANWGHDDRSVAVRVPPARGEGTRLEQRMADAAANPYLAGAAVLHAARLGVQDELELRPPQPVGEEPNTDVRVRRTSTRRSTP